MGGKIAVVEEIDLRGAFGCAAFTLRKSARVITQAYDSAMRAGGLRSTQFTIIVAVYRSPPLAMAKRSSLVIISQGPMRCAVALLNADRMVANAPHGERRVETVPVTDAGVRALAATAPLWRAVQQRFEQSYGTDNW